MKFHFGGTQIQRSTMLTNKREALEYERAYRTQLVKGEVGIERKVVPTLEQLSQQFFDYIETRHDKVETRRFYTNRMNRLLEWKEFRVARLDRIDEDLIARYTTQRRTMVSLTSVNRELSTLRRALHLAKQWKLIKTVPKVEVRTKDERQRDFVLPRKMEPRYLACCPPLLHDVAVVLMDTGLRLGECVGLRWTDVHFEPAGGARYGWVRVRDGKSKNAVRNVPLKARVHDLLKARKETAGDKSPWVFPGNSAKEHVVNTSLAHLHARVRREHEFPSAFTLHSLRHTMLTRLGEAGTDAFTIMRIAGHSSVVISQRYVHPTPEMVEVAFDRLEACDRQAEVE